VAVPPAVVTFTSTPFPGVAIPTPAGLSGACQAAYQQAANDAYTAGLLVFARQPGAADPTANQAMGDGCDVAWQRGWHDGYDGAARVTFGTAWDDHRAADVACYFGTADCASLSATATAPSPTA